MDELSRRTVHIYADWYNSSQTDWSSRSARNNSMTVLHSFVASSRSHSIPCRNFDRNRRCGRQTTRANHPADTPKQYWKVSLYYAFIDHMILELESRLIKSENRFYAQYLLPRVIGNITNEQIATLYETYQTDLTLDRIYLELPKICSSCLSRHALLHNFV
jgi:hypothetical protein